MDENRIQGTEEPTTRSVSRRAVLKTIGVGTAVAWAAPVIKSVPAFASASVGSAAPLCSNCRAQPDCGPPLGTVNQVCGFDTPHQWDCGCVSRHENGLCTCWNSFGYCVANGNICSSDGDCAGFGPGWQCLDLAASGCDVCGSATTFCGPVCNSTNNAPANLPAGVVRMH